MNGPEVLIPLFGIVGFFGCLGFILFLHFKTRHRERMALIESHQDASLFKQNRGVHSSLKWGYLGVATGIALIIGHFLEEYTTMDDGAGYFPMIFLLGGLALIMYYRRAREDGMEM